MWRINHLVKIANFLRIPPTKSVLTSSVTFQHPVNFEQRFFSTKKPLPPSSSICDTSTKKQYPYLSNAKCKISTPPPPPPKNTKKIIIGVLVAAALLTGLLGSGVFTPSKKEKKILKIPSKKRKKVAPFKDPKKSEEIPEEVPYLLIGGGTASFSAFRSIKSADPMAKVLVITNEPYYPYMRPPLSKEIWLNDDKEQVKKLMFKQWNGSERNLFYEPEDFYIKCKALIKEPNGGVAVARGWTITHVDPVKKIAYLEDGKEIRYDKCLIATGASPKTLPVFEAALDAYCELRSKVRTYRNIYDFQEIYDSLDDSKKVAIIGGGFLGSELACAIARRSQKEEIERDIYQIFKEKGNIAKVLPEYLSVWTMRKVENEGVKVTSQTNIVGVKPKDKKVELNLANGTSMVVDQVIIAVGVEPNTDIAEKSSLEVDPKKGGFLVNAELQARTDLYIAGDCTSFYDTKFGRRRIEHHDNAVVTGRLAGENMTGSAKPYLQQSMFWSDLGPDVGFEAVGLICSHLPTVGVFAKAPDCPPCPPGQEREDGANTLETAKPPHDGEDFSKGVVFYLRDDIVVGVLLWNVFNRMSIARQVLKDDSKYDDLNEVAKLFNIHED